MSENANTADEFNIRVLQEGLSDLFNMHGVVAAPLGLVVRSRGEKKNSFVYASTLCTSTPLLVDEVEELKAIYDNLNEKMSVWISKLKKARGL